MEEILIETKKQHIQKKTNVLFGAIVEVYRAIIGSCLIIFVSQKCNKIACSAITDKSSIEILYDFTYYFNFLTFISFFIMYTVEITREYRFIECLNINNQISNDEESIISRIKKLNKKDQKYIMYIDKVYIKTGYVAIVLYSINTILSAIVIFNENYMDNTTATGFFTNIIFMAIKLKNVYVIITNKSNEYVSAYLTDFVKYNDINRLKKENIMKSMRFDYNRSDTTRNINDYREDILNYSESNYSSISSRESFNTSISGDSYERCKSIESTESEIATAEKC